MRVDEPIFAIRTPTGLTHGGLFDICAYATGGTLVDLPNMQAHQRPATVTCLAIILATLRRYAAASPTSIEDWATEWGRQIGEDALRLIAPSGEVAFLQPPTEPEGSTNSIAEIDWLFQSQAHEAKPAKTGTPEQWAFALMGSTWRQYGGRGRPAGARNGLTVVLAGDGRTIGSEIRSLADAYNQMPTGIVGDDCTANSAADHMIWLQPHSGASTARALQECPHPFLDGRPVRLVEKDGEVTAYSVTSKAGQVDARNSHISDPHVPIKDGKPYKVIMGRQFDYRVQHAAIFGSAEVDRARILDLTEFQSVRICACATDPPGKTAGYWEATFSARRREGGFRFSPAGEDTRPADLSSRMLQTLTVGSSKVLWPALHRLTNSNEHAMDQTMAIMRSRTGTASVQIVLDILQSPIAPEAEQQTMNQLVANGIQEAFAIACTPLIPALRVADAESYLRWAISQHLGGVAMPDRDELPALAKQVFAILSDLQAHLTPNDRAQLRTMYGGEPPILFWSLMASVPESHTENKQCTNVWKTAFQALGQMRSSGGSVGRALAESDFPESRMSRLLAATGDTLITQLAEAVRWLLARDTQQADLSVSTALGLADALGDTAARDWARRRLALDYVRGNHSNNSKAA